MSDVEKLLHSLTIRLIQFCISSLEFVWFGIWLTWLAYMIRWFEIPLFSFLSRQFYWFSFVYWVIAKIPLHESIAESQGFHFPEKYLKFNFENILGLKLNSYIVDCCVFENPEQKSLAKLELQTKHKTFSEFHLNVTHCHIIECQIKISYTVWVLSGYKFRICIMWNCVSTVIS